MVSIGWLPARFIGTHHHLNWCENNNLTKSTEIITIERQQAYNPMNKHHRH